MKAGKWVLKYQPQLCKGYQQPVNYIAAGGQPVGFTQLRAEQTGNQVGKAGFECLYRIDVRQVLHRVTSCCLLRERDCAIFRTTS